MADLSKRLAKHTYDTLLQAVEANGWKCDRDDNALKIEYGLRGRNLNMSFTVSMDVERQLACLRCTLPFKFSGAKIGEGSLAISAANFALNAGNFNLKITDGSVSYRMVLTYRMSILSKEALLFLLNYSAFAIDKFYAGFTDVNNGTRPLQTVIEEFLSY